MASRRATCPICKLGEQEIVSDSDYGDKVTYNCNRCGKYTISRTAESVSEHRDPAMGLSAWIRERNIVGTDVPLLNSNLLKEVVANLPRYSPIEKQRKLLQAMEALTAYPGREVVLIPDHDAPLAWAENEHEFTYYVKSLMERGLIQLSNPEERTLDDLLFPMVITAAGWEYLETIGVLNARSDQAFVAMSFDSTLASVYDNGIAPAIEKAGYRSHRVDRTPHLERIDAKIIADIRASRFVVADVTQQKAGVYYEAGFAHGLGLPVIWCVHRDELANVHFDTRQYNHVLWTNENDLYETLHNVILATIGANAT